MKPGIEPLADARWEVRRLENAIAYAEKNPPRWFHRIKLWLLRVELFFAKGREQCVEETEQYRNR